MTTNERASSLSHDEIVALLESHDALAAEKGDLAVANDQLTAENTELRRQVAWFQRQLFGTKSERRILGPEGRQLFLGEMEGDVSAPAPTETVASYSRRKSRLDPGDETPPRFDPSVPVEVIRIPPPEPVSPETHEKVSEKTTDRLAQRPGSYVVLRYVREVWKRKEDGVLLCPPAPAAVLEKSLADVSLLAGLVIDKFQFHLPLYRQHQRMAAAGVHLTRATLTNWVHRTAELLEPIYEAQLASILTGSVIAMDETPIRAGRDGPGKMHKGYFWPIYGDRDEIAFPFSDSRSHAFVEEVLGQFGGTLQSDGYDAYQRHAERVDGLVHALCWSHTRRNFEEGMGSEPALCGEALKRIGDLYDVEAVLRKKDAPPEKRQAFRGERAKPIVDGLFAWLKETVQTQVLLPSNPFLQAARYAQEREDGLRVFLEKPEVSLDTNHLEREIRPIALGRKNWLFCWTEIGARYVGVIQSLISTCRLQGISPYTYLVDVLQRIDTHPAGRVHELTPRLWKECFAANPLRSDLDRLQSP
jgi:transposase